MPEGRYEHVVTAPEGFSHSRHSVASADGNPRGHGTGGDDGTGGRDRGTPSWYQSLVNYYDERSRKHRRWWDAVDDEYYQQDYTDEMSGLNDRMLLEEVRPGRVYSMVHTVEAMTFNRKPKLFLRGWNAKVQEEWVPVMEDVLNAEWYDDPALPREVRLCVRDTVKYGWGIMLSTYEAEFTEGREQTPDDSPAEPMVREALAEAEAEVAIEMAQRMPESPEIATFEQDDRIVFDNINSRRVDPRLFVCDPDATCPEDWKWVGRKIVCDLHALKEFYAGHPKVDELHSTERADIDYIQKRNTQDTSPYQYVTLYEIWERVPGGGWRYVLVPKDHDFILKQEDELYHMGCPYAVLRWNETGDDIFAQSDVLPAWTLILLERLLLTKVSDGYIREHEDTYIFDKQAGMSEEELNAVGDPGVAKYVGATQVGGRRLADLIYKLPKDAKSPEVLQLLAIVERELEVATGLGPNQRGQAMKSDTSASEAMEVAGFARARGQHKYGSVEEFVSKIASQRLALMIQFYDAERVARIVGEEGAKAWADIKGSLNYKGEIQKGMRVRVEQGSMKPENDDVRVQQLYALLQVVSQNPAMMASVNMIEILKDIARHLGHHRNTKYLLTEDAQKMAQAQAAMSLMQQGGGGQASQSKPNSPPNTQARANQQMAGAGAAPQFGGGA